ncbi:MAG: ECF transporter S component [Lachnospiraceae bacterium]|nr:ECF transporter S component [Lachnospiraceae bacterium]
MKTRKIAISGICLALCLVLPFVTGQIPEIGNMLCPMHLPVLLCGMICGWGYGAAVGVIAPLLRFVMFGRPMLFPTGISMCFELTAYGILAGVLYSRLHSRVWHVYISLLGAMLGGRFVWGVIRCIMAAAFGVEFSWQIFVTEGFVTAIPGMVSQVIVIPILVMALSKAGIRIDTREVETV